MVYDNKTNGNRATNNELLLLATYVQEAVTDLKARTKCSDTTYDKLGNNSIVKDSPLFFFPPQDETDGSLTPRAFGLRLCSGARIQTVRKSKTIEEIHSEVVTHVILLITVNKYRNIFDVSMGTIDFL